MPEKMSIQNIWQSCIILLTKKNFALLNLKKYICMKLSTKIMITKQHKIRVRYGETDPMKYVYYGNYAQYLEVARVELFRAIGISYNEIENRGIWLPVSEYKIKYIKPAKYDDLLTIETKITKLPTAKIEFEYTIFNEKKEKLTEASTTLFFLDAKTQKIIRCPEFLLELILKNWKE